MEKEVNRNTIVLIVMFIVALIIGLAGIIYLIVTYFDPDTVASQSVETPVEEVQEQEFDPSQAVIAPDKTETDEIYDYDFTYASVLGINTDFAYQIGRKASKINTPNSQEIVSLQISSIGVDATIIHDLDGDKAIDIGWWMYPASEDYGEKIILAHRRYWQPGHPYSAWNIDQLEVGTIIEVKDANGIVYKYQVASQAVRDGYDLGIFRPSEEDIIKIVTCSTWNGGAGSSDYRSVTIAVRVD